MIYNKFKDLELSALGMGTMRLPVVNGNDAVIDVAATEDMIAYAMQQGVNYYDTAWGYHDGNSESVVGKALCKYPRENYYIATKFPGYDLSNMDKVEEIFEKQLEKTGMEYFDFYLIHNVCEMNINEYLDEQYGIMPYVLKQMENGRIKHLGFSAHGSCDVMRRFLEAYGQYMEFCQIQLNWLDWTFQDAKGKMELCEEYHLPIWVMEPLRGGKLAMLSEENEGILKALRPDEEVAAWAFRFLQSLPHVVVTLSGMSDMEQLKKNLATYESIKPLNEKEMTALADIASGMLGKATLPCTACHYCVSHCPKQLDIPNLIELYNEHCFTGGGFLAPMALMAVPEEKQPSACIACRSCEKVCPQNIKISEAMADFSAKLGGA